MYSVIQNLFDVSVNYTNFERTNFFNYFFSIQCLEYDSGMRDCEDVSGS